MEERDNIWIQHADRCMHLSIDLWSTGIRVSGLQHIIVDDFARSVTRIGNLVVVGRRHPAPYLYLALVSTFIIIWSGTGILFVDYIAPFLIDDAWGPAIQLRISGVRNIIGAIILEDLGVRDYKYII